MTILHSGKSSPLTDGEKFKRQPQPAEPNILLALLEVMQPRGHPGERGRGQNLSEWHSYWVCQEGVKFDKRKSLSQGTKYPATNVAKYFATLRATSQLFNFFRFLVFSH